VQRVVSSGGPTPEELARCDVFNTILLIRQDTIEHIGGWDVLPRRRWACLFRREYGVQGSEKTDGL
jgi:hypothetical protein